MTDKDAEYDRIAEAFVHLNDDVLAGKMMSSPGLKCNGKVFAFSCKDGMGFRLGPEFDPGAFGVKDPQPLNPFKTKPPLKGWFIIGPKESGTWEELAGSALAFTRTL